MGFAELSADCNILRARLLDLEPDKIDLRHELTENFLPLIQGAIEEIQTLEAEVADLGEAMDVMIDAESDILSAESAAKIVGVLEIGKLIADEFEEVFAKVDEVTRKRAKALVKTYRQGTEVLYALIREITVPDDDEEEEDGDVGENAAPNDGELVDVEGKVTP